MLTLWMYNMYMYNVGGHWTWEHTCVYMYMQAEFYLVGGGDQGMFPPPPKYTGIALFLIKFQISTICESESLSGSSIAISIKVLRPASVSLFLSPLSTW